MKIPHLTGVMLVALVWHGAAQPIPPNPDLGTIEFTSPTYEMDELSQSSQTRITLKRTGALNSAAARVNILVQNGTADSSDYYVDYGAPSGKEPVASVLFPLDCCPPFPPGYTNTTSLQITPVDDGIPEGDETIHLTLQPWPGSAILGTLTNATVIIHNSGPRVSLLSHSAADQRSWNPGEKSGIVEGQPDNDLTFRAVRSGDRDQSLTIEYETTAAGTATPGRDFTPVKGTLHFEPGEREKSFAVAILDDGELEGPETVEARLFNPSPEVPLAQRLATGAITDNEFPTNVDVTFHGDQVPDFRDGSVAVQSSGKIIFIHSGGALRRLNADGSDDTTFQPDIKRDPSTPEGSAEVGEVSSIVILPDDRILIAGYFDLVNGEKTGRVARLLPDGALDRSFRAPSVLGDGFPRLAPAANGKIYVLSATGTGQNVLRLGPDGRQDDTFPLKFTPPGLGWIEKTAEQSTGKVIALDSGQGPRLIRLLDNGTLDPTFVPAITNNIRDILVVRGSIDRSRNDKIVLSTYSFASEGEQVEEIVQLLPDGAIDAGFKPLKLAPTWGLSQLIGDFDGRLLTSHGFLHEDGTLEQLFLGENVSLLPGPLRQPTKTSSTVLGQVRSSDSPWGWPIWRIELDRIFIHSPPPRSFAIASRVLAIGESNEEVAVTVYRLGNSSAPATVNFFTKDGSARAGQQYIGTNGVVVFAPLEVQKTISVRLRDDGAFRGRTEFFVALDDPAGAAPVSPPVKVQIADSMLGFLPLARPQSAFESVRLELTGVHADKPLVIEASDDLKSWQTVLEWDGSFEPSQPVMPFWPPDDYFRHPEHPSRFYRAVSR